MKKPKDYDLSYEAYGQFKPQKTAYNLSVTESFGMLRDARECVAMLLRGGCVKVAIHRVTATHVKKTYKKIPI